ncbi:MAG: hypothetical protein WCT77_06055 [Bacteroidota bacterium]
MKNSFTKISIIIFAIMLLSFLANPAEILAQAGGTQKGKTVTTRTTSDEQQIERLKTKPLHGFFGITFTNMVPQGEYFDNMQKTAQGFSLYGAWYPDPLPLVLGLQGDVLFSGSNEVIGNWYWYDPYGLPHPLKDTLTTQSMIIPITAFVRIQPNLLNWVYPYVEAFAGVNIFNLNTSYKTSFQLDYNYNTSENKYSASFCYGASVGLIVKLADIVTLPAMHNTVNLELKMRYSKGDKASWWKANIDQSTHQTSVQLTEFKSKTDMVLFLVGFTFGF